MLKKVAYVAIFYVIAISVRFYVVKIEPSFIAQLNTTITGLLSGISPLIGGLIMILVFRRKINYTFFSVGKVNTIVLTVLPIVLFSIAEYIETGKLTYTLPIMISASILYGFFEEFGWRGYLQSELSGLKPIYKYVIISLLWYPWHLDFGLDMAHVYSYIFVLGGSIGMGYVADKSKSLVLPALFHAFSNIIFGNVVFHNNINASLISSIIVVSISVVAIIVIMIKVGREKRKASI